ncbi:MAG: penicillin-binding protein 2 [Candidatus Komeilibacteria bacterium]|nr:penicillin-binding protein 2 [Candidatus Komeilibacteria bacterium]
MSNQANNPFSLKFNDEIKKQRLERTHHDNGGDGYLPMNSGYQAGSLISGYTLRWLYFLLALLLVLLGLRILYLQVFVGSHYRALAEGNRIRVVRTEPVRGIIYDRHGIKLVQNKPSYDVQYIPADLPEDDILEVIVDELAPALEMSTTDLLAKLKDDKNYSYLPLPLANDVSYEVAIRLLLQAKMWPGIQVVERSMRAYIGGPEFSHVLGYTGKITAEEYAAAGSSYQLVDYLGKSGLEFQYESVLRGQIGEKRIEVDALGKELKIIAENESVAGGDLILSIDAVQQKKLAATMTEIMQAKDLTRAAAVVMNPKTGEVLAMVSMPGYDNNLFSHQLSSQTFTELFENSDRPLFNRTISGQYPSGSTIKPLVAAAALQEDIIDEFTTFNSVGGLYYDIWFFPDWKAGGHGPTNVIKALAQSVNTFFYRIAIEEYDGRLGLGLDRLVKHLREFGLGMPTGIDLPGEVAGLVPTREWKWEKKEEVWYPGDTMHLAIGQGDILVTPLQLVNYISAIANNGTLWRPKLVNQMIVQQEKRVLSPEPLLSNFIDQDKLRIVREGMRAAVTSGSARLINSAEYQAAAKTGTAQAGDDKQHHSWLVGFAPYDDPEIAWVMLVENAGESTEVAVPIMKRYLDWYFSREDRQ